MASSSAETSRQLRTQTSSMDSERLSRAIRRIVLEQSKRADVGHIGSALSVADIVAALYAGDLNPDAPDRDRFVLSKGHAALALYAALYLTGRLTQEARHLLRGRLAARRAPRTRAAGRRLLHRLARPGAVARRGAALAARLQGSSRRAFALLSDAECNEGSVWEAVMFAAHHRLANLIAIVDLTGSRRSATQDVLDLSPLAERWRAFGWDVHEVDGHDAAAMARALQATTTPTARPHVLIARTTFGKGVSFMEGQIEWHYCR